MAKPIAGLATCETPPFWNEMRLHISFPRGMKSLRAFFECRRSALEEGYRFAGEVE